MNDFKEAKYQTTIFIVKDKDGEISVINKDEMATWMKQGDITVGDEVIECSVLNVYKAKSKIELTSTLSD